MSSVRAAAREINRAGGHIDALLNIAAVFANGYHKTTDGFELMLATNYFGPFLLTNLLRDRLGGGRVVTTSSDAHTSGRLDLDDLQSESSFSAMRVYGTTKLCNILFTRELARRAPELHANCFHPGTVRTGFGKNDNGIWRILTTLGGPFFRSPDRGARSLVWLALSEEAASLTGEYIEDEKVAQPSEAARDEDLAQRLWERSEQLVGLAVR
jgi:retinol dehydrogenase-12